MADRATRAAKNIIECNWNVWNFCAFSDYLDALASIGLGQVLDSTS